VVLLDRSMWGGLLDWMRDRQLARGFISPGDFDCIRCVDTPEEAVAIVLEERSRLPNVENGGASDGAARDESPDQG
jgi:predicted Rossmann-fold nucleotide-binding protein